MKLFIPTIGTRIKLGKDWTFTLWKHESRNIEFAEKRGLKVYKNYHDFPSTEGNNDSYHEWSKATEPITLEKGRVLIVDRIYIRQQAKDFDSITFKIEGEKGKGFGGANRFWAKLDDVNKIEGEILGDVKEKMLKLNATIEEDALGLFVKTKGGYNQSKILRPGKRLESVFKRGDKVASRAWVHNGKVQTADKKTEEVWGDSKVSYTWIYNLLKKELKEDLNDVLSAIEKTGPETYWFHFGEHYIQGPKDAIKKYEKAVKIAHAASGTGRRQPCDCVICSGRISVKGIVRGISDVAESIGLKQKELAMDEEMKSFIKTLSEDVDGITKE